MKEYQILIVDDEPGQLRILTGNLIESNPDYKLLIATNGRAAFEVATKNKPDLILMDWEMPVMNGIESIKALKGSDETKGIPVIMVTGAYNESEKIQEALNAGAVDFICKPFNQAEMNARINAQIRNIETLRQLYSQKEIISKQQMMLYEREKQMLEFDLRQKQKQLTISTINLLKNSNLLQSLIEDINKIKPFTGEEGKKILKSIISKINDKSSERMWTEFEHCFGKVHTEFISKLVEKIPDITVREKRLCAFLKLNMSTKEISAITFQSQNAIDVAKHRLRKKAGLENEEDLVNFLINL